MSVVLKPRYGLDGMDPSSRWASANIESVRRSAEKCPFPDTSIALPMTPRSPTYGQRSRTTPSRITGEGPGTAHPRESRLTGAETMSHAVFADAAHASL